MGQSGTRSLSLDDIEIGSICVRPIKDEAGLLLIGESTEITEAIIQGLRDRGLHEIWVDPSDVASLCGKPSTEAVAPEPPAPTPVRESKAPRQWKPSQSVKSMLVDRHDEGLDPERSEMLGQAFADARHAFTKLRPSESKVDQAAIAACDQISNAYARSMIDDLDHTIGSIAPKSPQSDLADRSVQLSVMAMAVAVELGLDGIQVTEIGTAGLLHDIALFTMDPRFLDPTKQFTEADLWEYQKHPEISIECLGKEDKLSSGVAAAITQLHEQYDGSGYPRGLSNRRIHLYARILNVVDTYLQLTNPAYSRPAIIAHDAIGVLLHQATVGRFDPKVVRAFLATATLFPIGSAVELDSGDIARVIRRPRQGYSMPVLESIDGDRIELESGSMEVIRPAIDPVREQMRLTPELMITGRDTSGAPLLPF